MELRFKLISAAVVIILALFFVSISLPASEQASTTTGGEAAVLLKVYDANNKTVFEKTFNTSIGANAFGAMKNNVKVEYDSYSFGVFVKSIDGASPPNKYYFALFVNGAYANKGISGYTISNDTVIEWKVQKIEGAPV